MQERFEKRFDFADYSVVLRNCSITYEFIISDVTYHIMVPTTFDITIDDESVGRKIEIKYRDRWGCEMIFIHYPPADLKGMFDFIGRGYRIKNIK